MQFMLANVAIGTSMVIEDVRDCVVYHVSKLLILVGFYDPFE